MGAGGTKGDPVPPRDAEDNRPRSPEALMTGPPIPDPNPVLGVATGAAPPASRFGDLGVRVLSALALAIVAGTAIWVGGIWTALLIAALCGLMAREWRSITLHRGAPAGSDGALMVLGAAGGVLVGHLAGPLWGGAFLLGVAGANGILDLLRSRRRAWRYALLGTLYIGASGIVLDTLRGTEPYGLMTVVWIVLVVAAADIGGYFAGKTFGGPRLWPAVSPKKTWSGALGGIALAFLLGGLFSWATTGTYFVQVCIVSSIAAVLSQMGDLGESAVKRRYGVKDAGRFLPGHGGALDRFDGLMAATLVAGAVTFARGQTVFIW